MKFEEWMKSAGLSKSSIEKYVGAIDGPLTAWANAHSLLTGPLRAITDPMDFADISQKIANTPEYRARNIRGHQMYRATLKRYAEFLGILPGTIGKTDYGQGPHTATITVLEAAEELSPYVLEGQKDAREKVLREVVQRRGQPKFRLKLIDAYESRCAITGCAVLPILEAAHITPYLGPATNMIGNGILLRADIHTLWDLGLIAIDPGSKKVWVSPKIGDESYQELAGVTAFEPKESSHHASPEALKRQWVLVQKGLFAK